jgi:type IV pilus assembly protein PilC
MQDQVADFFKEQVDEAVAALASLTAPPIMVVLGVLIGSLVMAMYMPIFKPASSPEPAGRYAVRGAAQA